jgi:hypothetical protein
MAPRNGRRRAARVKKTSKTKKGNTPLPPKTSDIRELRGMVKIPHEPDLIEIADALSDITSILEVAICALDALVAERTEGPKAIMALLDVHALEPLHKQIKQLGVQRRGS